MQVLRSSFSVGRASVLRATQVRCNSKISTVKPDFSGPIFSRKPETETLGNGLRVSTYPLEGTNAASVTLHVKTGSRFEADETNGANFFIEKLAFAGKSPSGKSTSLAEAVEDIGGFIRLSNNREHTAYTISVESSQIKEATKLLAQAVSNLSSITPDQVEAIRYQVLKEKASLDNCKIRQSMDHLHAVVYQQSTLGLPIQGTTANLQKMNAQTLSNVVNKFYTTENITLAVAGDVDSQSFVKDASELFSKVSVSNTEITSEPTRYYGAFVNDRSDGSDDARVIVAYNGCRAGDSDGVLLEVVREMLGDYDKWSGVGNNSSTRLAEEVGTENMADTFHTFVQSYSDAGLVGVAASSQGKHLDNLICEICYEFVRMAHNARPAEVERAKASLKHRILLAHNGVAELSRKAAYETSQEGHVQDLKSKLDEIDAVTVDRIRDVCARKFTDTEPGLVGVGSTQWLPDYNQVRGWTHWWRI